MKGVARDFELKAAASVEAVTAHLAVPGWRLFAGGTDIMVLFEAGALAHPRWLSIWGLDDLKRIEVTAQAIELGCLVTYAQIQAHPLLKTEFPNLGMAAAETGSIAIQNRGTLGGNIANASPAADSPPPLLSYDASVKLTSVSGERWLPYAQFHLGYKQTALAPGEWLSGVRLPRRDQAANSALTTTHYFRKVGARGAQAISKVVAAAYLQSGGGKLSEVRLAFGSVGPTTARCPRTEAMLIGESLNERRIEQAAAELQRELTPIDDIRSSRAYRLAVAANLLRDCLNQAKSAAAGR